jgi:hypothetical protein
MAERALSCFFVKELFPLYSEGHLDSQRTAQVKSHLGTCKECKIYYDKLEGARLKISQLSQTKVSPGVIEYLKQEHHFWTQFGERLGWKKWPSTLKWAIELSTVTLILITSIHFFPWVNFVKTVQKMRPKPQMAVVETAPVPIPKTESAEPTAPPAATPVQVAVKAPVSTPAPTQGHDETPTQVAKQENINQDEEENSQTAGVSEGGQKASGFVWRGTLKVEDLTDELAAHVTKAIVDLGGTKAGQVELGWHRGNERYYHFILPEDNYEKLLSVLNQDGIVQLTQERHPRVIKAGHMRIIMTLEESGE